MPGRRTRPGIFVSGVAGRAKGADTCWAFGGVIMTWLAIALATITLAWLAWRLLMPPAGMVFDFADPRLLAAKQQARATLPDFWAACEAVAPGDSDFMLKFDLNHGRGLVDRESIWADVVAHENGVIRGQLANPPRNGDFREGDVVEIAPDSIDDWAFMRGGVAQGHYVTRVIVELGPPSMARETKQALGW